MSITVYLNCLGLEILNAKKYKLFHVFFTFSSETFFTPSIFMKIIFEHFNLTFEII